MHFTEDMSLKLSFEWMQSKGVLSTAAIVSDALALSQLLNHFFEMNSKGCSKLVVKCL